MGGRSPRGLRQSVRAPSKLPRGALQAQTVRLARNTREPQNGRSGNRMSTEALTPAAPGPAKTRAHALRSFDVADFPALTGREEEWRFTPLKRLGGLATADGAGERQAGFAATSVEHDDLPAGVTVEWVGRDDGRIGSVLTPFDRISALAYGKFASATVVRMDRGALLDRAAVVRVLGAKAGELDFGHMFIDIGEVAEGTLVIEYSGSATLEI